MPVIRINEFVDDLDFARIEAALFAPDRPETDPGFELCEAPFQDWVLYVKAMDEQELMSRSMMWRAGKIYVVELPNQVHELCRCAIDVAMLSATGTGARHLLACGSTYVNALVPLEPDASFGPNEGLGARRPSNMAWTEFHTLKVEIGVARRWPQLDERAEEWSHFPGVQYILCLRFTRDLSVRQFKLHSVVNGALTSPPHLVEPQEITRSTLINLDSHRLLGLPGDASLPTGFARPAVVLDLFSVVKDLLFTQ